MKINDLSEMVKKFRAKEGEYIERKIRKNITFCKLIILIKSECEKNEIAYCSQIARELGFSQSYIHNLVNELIQYGIVKINPLSTNLSEIVLVKNDNNPVIDKYIDLCVSVLKNRGVL